MTELSLNFDLELLGNFHIGSGMGIAGLVDQAVARQANRKLVIPGSTVKGRVRYYAERIARAFKIHCCSHGISDGRLCKPDTQKAAARGLCLTCRLFGSSWWPSSLRFSDAYLAHDLYEAVADQDYDYQVINHTRTRINRISRRVEEGALYTIQEGVAGLTFKGQVAGSLPCLPIEDLDPPVEVLALIAALRMTECLGGKKTVGLGTCQLTITQLQLDETTLTPEQINTHLCDHLEWLGLYDGYRNR